MKKFAFGFLLALFTVFSVTGLSLAAHAKKAGEPVLTKPSTFVNHAVRQVGRDDDKFLTYRYMFSTDGGQTWSDIMNVGDTHMWEIGPLGDTVSAFNAASYDFSAMVDKDNYLHFIVVLSDYRDLNNPDGMKNGVYDVKTNMAGDNVTWKMIAEQPDSMMFDWPDCGVDTTGNLYAIWSATMGDETTIWGSKSTDAGANWMDGVELYSGMNIEGHYPHMTPHVGDHFYILWQDPNAETQMFDQNVIEVPADLSGMGTNKLLAAASGTEFSYYITSVVPIDMDPMTGDVYTVFRNADVTGTSIVRYKSEVADWTLETLPGSQRYPSVLTEMATPWVFSNFGVPPEPPHSNWFAYDALGYGGGDWVGPDTVMSIPGNELLYCNYGVFTSGGRLVDGSNVWNNTPAVTPSGFMVAYSDDQGATWSDTMRIFNAWSDGFDAKYLPQISILPGMDNSVWIAFAGRYGVTDLTPPTVDDDNLTLSSYTIGQPWVVSAKITDDANGVGYAEIDWLDVNSTGDSPDWEWIAADSADTASLDPLGNGTYYFHMPSDSMHGAPIAPGDTIQFFIYTYDGVQNEGVGVAHMLIANSKFFSVDQPPVVLPTKVALDQNYPNPFNSSTVIPFTLSRPANVNLNIFDINGRLVANLYAGNVSSGKHQVSWNGADVSSGIYFYVLEVAGQRYYGKMTYIR